MLSSVMRPPRLCGDGGGRATTTAAAAAAAAAYRETIHSGHFMVSDIDDSEAQDDDDVVSVPVSEGDDRDRQQPCCQRGYDFDGAIKETSNTYNFGPRSSKSVSIDATLTKLFRCMTLAYSGKLTSPRWKNFKGMKLRWKDKIRLNNVIWRAWHMQFVQKRRPTVCTFASPVEDSHVKPEAVVLEGKYWKRQVDTVRAEYKSWRVFTQKSGDRRGGDVGSDGSGGGVYDWQPRSNQSAYSGSSMLIDDDAFGEYSDTLFSCLLPSHPFPFPNPREIARAGIADFIQPGLVQFQPNLDDFMDTFDWFTDVLAQKLPPVFEEAGEGARAQPQEGSDGGAYGSGMDFGAPPLAPRRTANFHAASDAVPPPRRFATPAAAPTMDVAMGQGLEPKLGAVDLQMAAEILIKDGEQQQRVGEASGGGMFAPPDPGYLFPSPSPPHLTRTSGAASPLQGPGDPAIQQPLMMHAAPVSPPQKYPFPYAPGSPEVFAPPPPVVAPDSGPSGGGRRSSVGYDKGVKSRKDSDVFAVPKPKLRTRSRSGPSLGHMLPQQQQQTSPPPGCGALLAQLLATGPYSPAPDKVTATTSTARNSSPTTVAILPNTSSATQTIVVTPVTWPGVTSVNNLQNQVLVGATSQVFGLLPPPGKLVLPPSAPPTVTLAPANLNSMASAPLPATADGLVATSPKPFRPKSDTERKQYREHRRVCHINAEQKRRCNIKNGFDTLHHLVPCLSHSPNTKVSKAAMLQKAGEYIKQLKVERAQLQEEAELLKKQIDDLNQAINMCQSQLPATGAPVPCQRPNKLQKMFEAYVRERILQNWKFWLFSRLIQPLLESYSSCVSTASVEDLCKTVLTWLEQHCSLVSLRPVVFNSLRHLTATTNILTDPGQIRLEAEKNTH